MSAAVRAGYKLTEVGVIPADWIFGPVGGLLERVKSGLSRRLQEQDVGIPVLTSGNIQDSRLVTDELKYWYMIDPQGANVENYILDDGDILLCFINSISQIGKPCIFKDIGRPSIYTTNIFRIVVSKQWDSQFVYFLFSSKAFQDSLQLIVKPAINQASFTKADFLRISVPFPPDESEQRAIATALSDVDELLAKLDALIAKKRDLKVATMQQLLTGQTRLPGFSGEWQVRRLGDVTDVDPENLAGNTAIDYEFNYISLDDVDQGVLRSYSEQLFITAPSRARRKLKLGDVLVSTVRPNLQSHLHFKNDAPHWICSTGFAVVRCRSGVTNSAYVFAHIFGAGVSRQIETLLTGSSYPAINSRDVRALEIPLPPYEEQTAIATVLSDMDTELTALEARRDKTRALKQGMMQELLTGRIRLI